MKAIKLISLITALMLAVTCFAACNTQQSAAPLTLEALKGSGVYSLAASIWQTAGAKVNEVPFTGALDGTESNVVRFAKRDGIVSDGSSDVSSVLSSVCGELAATGGYIHFDVGSYLVSADVSVPDNIILSFAPGAELVIAEDVTVTVAADRIFAPLSRIFAGEGAVKAPGLTVGFPQWFGGYVNDDSDDSAAFTSAFNAFDRLYLVAGGYTIENEVVIPQGRILELIGQGQYSLVTIRFGQHGGFRYLREENAARTELSVTGVCLTGTGATAFDFRGIASGADSTLKISNFIYSDLACLVNIEYVNGCEFYDCRGTTTNISFNLGAKCDDTFFGTFLSLSGGAFIIADGGTEGGSGITLVNSCSVWAYAADLYFNNYSDISVKQGGYDLGCNKTGKKVDNRAAVIFENCTDVVFEGNWVASNNAPPNGTTNNAAPDRNGVMILKSKNVTVTGNSIVNCKIGLYADNEGISGGNIVITGNKGEGSLLHDFYLMNCDGVSFNYNFCLSYHWRRIAREISGGGGLTDVEIIGNSLGNPEYDLKAEMKTGTGCKIENNLFSVT